MDIELKTKWLEALRSGKYKQGQHRLRTGDQFCCLGVLCDIVSPEKWFDAPEYKRIASVYAHEAGVTGVPGEMFLERVGLTPDLASHLADGMNDQGFPFSEIADFIAAVDDLSNWTPPAPE